MPPRKLNRLRFSLRFLLLAVVVLCWWLAVEVNLVHRQQRAIEIVQQLGGTVWYDYQGDGKFVSFGGTSGGGSFIALGGYDLRKECPGTAFFRRFIGDDYFRNLSGVNLSGKPVTYSDVLALSNVDSVKVLVLDRTRITDDGLQAVGQLTRLKVLVIDGNGVTDVGIAHLNQLKELEYLSIGTCHRVSAASLEEIAKLTGLRALTTSGTQFTDTELDRLQQRMNLGFLNGRVLK